MESRCIAAPNVRTAGIAPGRYISPFAAYTHHKLCSLFWELAGPLERVIVW